jgi:ABC-type microcin C transport system permease subunit YejB
MKQVKITKAKKVNVLMASPFGSFLKAFLAVVITLAIAMPKEELFSLNGLINLAYGALISTAPVVLNWLNPNYQNYGR